MKSWAEMDRKERREKSSWKSETYTHGCLYATDLLSVRRDKKVVGHVRWKNVFQENFVDGRHRFDLFLLHSELASPDEVQLGRDLSLTNDQHADHDANMSK